MWVYGTLMLIAVIRSRYRPAFKRRSLDQLQAKII